MSVQPAKSTQAGASWGGDFWGGLASMLVALPSALAFGVVVYTAIGPGHAGQGAMAGMLGAAALGIVAPLVGRTGGLISAPCAPSAAVLSALVAELLSGHGSVSPESIPGLLALTALLGAGFQFLYGVLGGGKLIKYVPYPVVCGYLSGVGVLIALGQLPKLFGFGKDTPLFYGLTSPGLWRGEGLVVGIVTMVVMVVAPRLTKKVPAAILGLLGGMLVYFGIGLFRPELLTLSGNALVIGPLGATGSFFGAIADRATSLLSVDLAAVKLILVPAITLSALLSIDTLKTCVVLDTLTRSRHNSNRELRGQGLANFAAFLTGGMPGAGTMGPTLVNVTSGGRTWRAGVLEGLFVIGALLLLGRVIAWVPLGALAGILLIIAYRMFDTHMFQLLRTPAGRFDFAVIATVVLVALTVDLIAASGAGIALAILLFIRDQIRNPVLRRKRTLKEASSKTRRLTAQRQALDEQGNRAMICELQGNLFFGTTDQLYTELEPDLPTKRFLLFDLRRIQSVDYTAVHVFDQLQALLAERDGRLLFSGMPSGLLRQLEQLGLQHGDGGVLVCDTQDGALEWMEEQLLEEAGLATTGGETPLDVDDIELFREFTEEELEGLRACLREVTLAKGELLFAAGEVGDELFLVRKGAVQVLLPLTSGQRHHLATFGRGDFFGELSFLDRGPHSADAEARVDTQLYALSRTRFDEQSRADPALGARVFARIAIAIAERLRLTDDELQVLQER